ncbi:uncharacterized protein E0L32_005858 [Thyridium curvatum]|uniref:Uncharacterized protein n=1 Tax=Thyridium curvatum TaxID=1093900 RepID=A0A507AS84_9PEZI|nr:uncharacterized protein E0L32_005858 [Thyridium curvatum]TPX13655.1 hypothetical protein E0L32_005858 [Thyridium curvatum]
MPLSQRKVKVFRETVYSSTYTTGTLRRIHIHDIKTRDKDKSYSSPFSLATALVAKTVTFRTVRNIFTSEPSTEHQSRPTKVPPIREYLSNKANDNMCYYEQTRWRCGYWRWGNFRQQCTKEYRTGETCGLKLVYDTMYNNSKCKLCEQMEKKERRWTKMAQDLERWRREGNRRATIEKTEGDMQDLRHQINKIWLDHQARQTDMS